MEQLPTTGRYAFLAEPFHCDFSQRLFMGHLGNQLLNTADFHSSEHGYGLRYLNTIGKTWVLSRLSIEMTDMPRMYDKFYIETWIDDVFKSFTSRNFKILGTENHVYGYGKSMWAMIDTKSRQPVDLLAVNDGKITEYIEKGKSCPIEKSSRVKMGKTAEYISSIDTYYNDVDINGHINSIKYIEHVLDLWSLEWYEAHLLKRFEVAYVAEAHLGDKLKFYRAPASSTNTNDFFVRITKSNTEGETEVCRARLLF